MSAQSGAASKIPSQPLIFGGLAVVAAIAVAGVVGGRSWSAPASSLGATAVAQASLSQPGDRRVPDTSDRASGFAAADLSRQGGAAYTKGDFASALTEYTAAVEADPGDTAALNNLGQLLVRTGRAREAIPYFDRAIEAAGDVWSYHFNRARAYSELKEWSQAIAGYTEAERLFPGDYATQFNLARARQASGDLAGAIQNYEKAVQLAPGQPDFQLWHGRALDLAGRQSEASAAYRRFLEMQPDGPEADKVKTRLSQLGGKVEGAPPSAP